MIKATFAFRHELATDVANIAISPVHLGDIHWSDSRPNLESVTAVPPGTCLFWVLGTILALPLKCLVSVGFVVFAAAFPLLIAVGRIVFAAAFVYLLTMSRVVFALVLASFLTVNEVPFMPVLMLFLTVSRIVFAPLITVSSAILAVIFAHLVSMCGTPQAHLDSPLIGVRRAVAGVRFAYLLGMLGAVASTFLQGGIMRGKSEVAKRGRLRIHRKVRPFGVMQRGGPNRRRCDYSTTRSA
jgi:hypothetical protein